MSARATKGVRIDHPAPPLGHPLFDLNPHPICVHPDPSPSPPTSPAPADPSRPDEPTHHAALSYRPSIPLLALPQRLATGIQQDRTGMDRGEKVDTGSGD